MRPPFWISVLIFAVHAQKSAASTITIIARIAPKRAANAPKRAAIINNPNIIWK